MPSHFGPEEPYYLKRPELDGSGLPPTTFDPQVEWLLASAETRLKAGEAGVARQMLELILIMDKGHERASLKLYDLSSDWSEKLEILQNMLKHHPDNETGQSLLKLAELKFRQLQRFDKSLSGSGSPGRIEPVEQRQGEGNRFSFLPPQEPVPQIGLILLENGFVTALQLHEALSSQALAFQIKNQKLLGEVMVEAGYLNREQLEYGLELQRTERESRSN